MKIQANFVFMKIAAIDVGSNAIRLQITSILEFDSLITFKKLQYIRFPLRLGQDVFSTNRISDESIDKLKRLLSSYKNMIDLYEVDHYFGCATSAMRDAENGQAIIGLIETDFGLKIEIISVEKEAELINSVIGPSLDEKTYLHIDVGGGSTELNFYINKVKVLSKSFDVGTVRILNDKVADDAWLEMKSWINQKVINSKKKIRAIGTGGNINKLIELAMVGNKRKMDLMTLMKVRDFILNLDEEQKLNRLQLNPDRSDVIIPASDIYIAVMQAANAKSIYVPDLGLKDGINHFLYEKHYPTKGKFLIKN